MILHPVLRRLGLALAAIAIVAVAAFLGLAAFVHTGRGEAWVAAKAEQAVPGLTLEGLSVTWPFNLAAGSVDLADDQGVWLHVEAPVLDWRPTRLLRGILKVDRFEARQVVVRRPPSQDESDGGDGGGGLPKLQFQFDRLSAPIVLEPPVLGERVALDLAGTFQKQAGGGAVDVHLRAEQGGLIRLVGTAATDFLDLRWYVEIPRLARWQRLAGIEMDGRLSGDGLVSGRLPSPVITGMLHLDDGHVGGWGAKGLDVSLRAIPRETGWQAALGATIRQPRPPEGTPLLREARLTAAFDIDPAERRLRIGQARLISGGNEARVTGILAEWGRRADLRVVMAVRRLADLPGGLSGRIDADAWVSGDLMAPDLRAILRMDASRLTTGIDLLDRLLGPSPQARGIVALRGERPRLLSATIDGARARVTGLGDLWPRLDLHARLEVPDLSVLHSSLSGSGVARGRVAGAYDALASWGEAQLDNLIAAGSPKADGRAVFDFSLAGAPSGWVSAVLDVAGRPVEASARIATGDVTRIDDLSVTSRGGKLTGELTVGQGIDGRVTLAVPSLRDWRRELGRPLAGALEAEAVLQSANRQTIRLTARGRGLSGEGGTARQAELKAVVSHLDDNPTGIAVLDARGVTRGELVLDRLTARVEGDPSAFRFTAEGAGQGAALGAGGTARIDGPRGLVAFDRLRLTARGREVALVAPTRVLWGPDGVRAEPVALALAGGRIDASGEIVRGRIAAEARLARLPLELLEVLAPVTDAVGQVDGNVTIGGTVDSPTASVELDGSGVGFSAAARAGIGRMAVSLEARWADGRVEGRADARDGERLRLSVDGSAPLEMGDEAMPAAAPISGNLALSGDLGRITETLPLAGHVFAGRFEAAATIGGTVGQPRVVGNGNLTGGRYENLEFGTIVTGLDAEISIDGDHATVRARGGDGRDGRVALDGQVRLDGEPRWQGDLSLDGFRGVRRDDVQARVSADLALSGQGASSRLSGRAEIGRAEIDIARLQGSGPVTLDVVEVNVPGRSQPTASKIADEAASPLTIALAVDVTIDRAFVRGRGLDSEWSGALKVAGTLDDPRLTGRLSPDRGRYDFLGRAFTLVKESAVVFDGGMTPRLDVTAEADAGDITARVQLTGTVATPQVEITSEPPLPRDEVLSRVLFGTEPGRLSAFQQIQLGQMAAGGLTGGDGGFDPIGKVRGALGLDVLELGSADDQDARAGNDNGGGPTLSAGKYIGDDTFLRVEQGTTGIGSITLERELGRGLAITTELGQQSGGGVGVEWRRNY